MKIGLHMSSCQVMMKNLAGDCAIPLQGETT
jgi:hypothetical protein